MKVCGIDPGLYGGLALVDEGVLTVAIPMPLTEDGYVDSQLVGSFLRTHKPDKVYIERVGSRPGNAGQAMFNFGYSTGSCHGAAGALMLPVEKVNPNVWQVALLGDKPKGQKREKIETIDFIRQSFPAVSLKENARCRTYHDGMADAAAIALYGWRKEANVN